jgi:hypothetical protein
MQNNKLRMAIRATAAVTVLGLASQAQAFSFSAGDVDADVYGYARLNASYDINEDIADAGQSGSIGSVSDSDNEGHFGLSAVQSRIGAKAKHESGASVTVEGDFYGNGGGGFRLRHAYGEYNGILAGQTWSNFNSFTGNTPTLDFSGAIGWAGTQARDAQIRYTTGGFSVSLEEPKSSIDGAEETELGDPAVVDNSEKRLPSLTARYEGSSGPISFSGAGVINQVAYEDSTDDDSAVGFGVFGAAKFQVTDMVSVQGNLQYTDGANSYLYLSGGDDAYIDDNGSLETVSGMGGTIGTSVSLGSGRSVNVVYGMTKIDVDDSCYADSTNETRANLLANYMFTPVENVTMGVELQHWMTETKGGDSEDANRILFAAQYNF